MPPPARKFWLFRRLNRDGTTLVVVTHDEGLAAAGRPRHSHAGWAYQRCAALSPTIRHAVLITLAFRHLLVRKLRSFFLLLGFSLGVGVMIVLLSVGEAMLEQSRDVSLVGGGEVTVLPQGIDVEAMRTGGVSGMFFGIDRARFLSRLMLGGPRYAGMVRVVSPGVEGKLLYLRTGIATVPVRAGGDVPSRARAVGSGLDVTAGVGRIRRLTRAT